MVFRHGRSLLTHSGPARPRGRARAVAVCVPLVLAAWLLAGAIPEAAASPSPAAGPVGPPENLHDLSAWLDYKTRSHVHALPAEARLFYRRGLMLHRSGATAEAQRMVRGAAELDPAYVAPHLTLASWFLLREPSQSLLHYAAVLELAKQDFAFQLAAAGNLAVLGLQALFLGLLAAGLIVVALRQRELRHAWSERLGRFVTPETARWWSWALLVAPFLAGIGLAVPTLVFLGLLWPMLRLRERALFVLLLALVAGASWTVGALERLTLPLREDLAPVHGVALLENAPATAERRAAVDGLAAGHPGSGFLEFASGWLARRAGDLPAAEAAYRRALEAWPDDDRVLNNLGNVLAMQGRPDEALALYQQAVARNAANAPAWFNASQIYTQRFEYHSASDAVTRASALNFDLVRTYQAQATDDGVLPLADQWIAPEAFWAAVPRGRAEGMVGLRPPAWRGTIECSGLPFSALAVALALAALAAGVWLHRSVPLRACSNCGRIVCRRCARRRREVALCPGCATLEARAETPEFARVLLMQERRRELRRRRLARTALATLVPGFGLLAVGRMFTPVVLLAVSAALVGGAAHWAGPFAFEPRLALSGQDAPAVMVTGLWIGIYVVSIVGYHLQAARADAREAALTQPVRSRASQPTRHLPAAA